MNDEQERKPNLLETLLSMVFGVYETGLGFLQTLMGFVVVRLFYAIPVWLVWAVIIVRNFNVPNFNFIEVWAILAAFDCFRFDITKFAPMPEE